MSYTSLILKETINDTAQTLTENLKSPRTKSLFKKFSMIACSIAAGISFVNYISSLPKDNAAFILDDKQKTTEFNINALAQRNDFFNVKDQLEIIVNAPNGEQFIFDNGSKNSKTIIKINSNESLFLKFNLQKIDSNNDKISDSYEIAFHSWLANNKLNINETIIEKTRQNGKYTYTDFIGIKAAYYLTNKDALIQIPQIPSSFADKTNRDFFSKIDFHLYSENPIENITIQAPANSSFIFNGKKTKTYILKNSQIGFYYKYLLQNDITGTPFNMEIGTIYLDSAKHQYVPTVTQANKM